MRFYAHRSNTTLDLLKFKLYTRGGQLDQLRDPHFRRQQSARAMCSTLTLAKSKYRSVLTDELLTEPVQTALIK
jgi:hypothetical protein